MHYEPDWLEDTSIDVLLKDEKQKALVLYNDDVNTFDYVIESLVRVCGHDPLQAEQCTHLIHFKGKCAVKSGSFRTLRPMCEALLERGLSAVIEN
ncbi:MAG TPA: ATP-dependent Clp protease adaptor ClpS [Bacteroidia bacterium]|nr:ATP-dependent Clp protease adaptor ClpS [Bacteroidia bacterium]